ncbi:hypothetical protein K435DRAFT_697128 [Dendrothele bispora CBS 962.96]|uniref:CCHC-type domain-containing protein n=1 Tax=Dendrothele bispora (strain CBS 962.96) TaxID=1314807 RepID=A0A4S8KV34_DENBC|nr:hypothetical protein K435DRAFT_697128 [Dendrothele bispora CBS 962.96]
MDAAREQARVEATVGVPALHANDPALSKSLFHLFYRLDQKLLVDITRHEFRPYDLFKLDTRVCQRADRSSGGLDTLLSCPGSHKDYPSLEDLLIPLLVYFEVLVAYLSTSSANASLVAALALGTTKYISHLTDLSRQYKWAFVLDYHWAYHGMRRLDMKDGFHDRWGAPDAELLLELIRHPQTRGSSSSGKSTAPLEEQPCWGWNSGKCKTSPCPDGRAHKCKICGSPEHVNKDCPKKGSAKSQT